MNKCDEIQKLLIDEFYIKELDTKPSSSLCEVKTRIINEHIENCSDCMEYRSKLYATAEKLNILEAEDLSTPNDLFNIINTAENIKVEKKNRLEIFSFVFAALCILIPFVGLGLYFGVRILLFIQIFVYFNFPLVLIPLIINRKIKGVER